MKKNILLSIKYVLMDYLTAFIIYLIVLGD